MYSIHINIPDDKYKEAITRLYEKARQLGYTYPKQFDNNEGMQKMGKNLAISKMLTDLALGKLDIIVKK